MPVAYLRCAKAGLMVPLYVAMLKVAKQTYVYHQN